MRIFLDANILFSAAKSAGAVRAFLAQLRATGHILVVDGYVAGEARRNLEAKFPQALGDFEILLTQVEATPGVCGTLPKMIAPDLPEKDRPVLAASIQRHCDVLMAGDKTHFGLLYGQSIKGVTIHSPASLANGEGIGCRPMS
jgi:predicted nucleic acid-binding protein